VAVRELIAPGPAAALAGLLGVPAPERELPLLWHWVYLLDRPAQADLGPDGHPVRGAVLVPPGPGRRRMWAGGRVRATATVHIGAETTRRSEVTAAVDKQGRTGPLTIVTVTHEIAQAGRTVLVEEQDVVYRDAAGSLPAGPVAPAGPVPAAPGDWEIATPPTLLFRFSALTYNGHRIHYDRDYARDVEGYPGLVTHGPLQALAMAYALRAAAPGTFSYRLVAPLFDFQGMRVRAAPDGTVAVTDRSGRRTATGRWEPA
jgi:3-methylfumaryl-CoA hydratase